MYLLAYIREYAWVGAGATILPGVCIGRHAIVGAGSVVTKDVPDYAVAAVSYTHLSQLKLPLSTMAPPTQDACPSIYFVVE